MRVEMNIWWCKWDLFTNLHILEVGTLCAMFVAWQVWLEASEVSLSSPGYPRVSVKTRNSDCKYPLVYGGTFRLQVHLTSHIVFGSISLVVSSPDEDYRLVILIVVSSFIILSLILIIGITSCILICFEDSISDVNNQTYKQLHQVRVLFHFLILFGEDHYRQTSRELH